MLTLAATNTIQGQAGADALTHTISGLEVTNGVENYKTLAQGQVPTSAAALYAVPPSTVALVKTIHIKNTTAAPVPLTISVNVNPIFSAVIPANGTCVFDGSWKTYDANGFLQYVGATGPAGLKGDPGIQGEPGIQGVPGEVPASRQIIAGNGLSGGGSLANDRTLTNADRGSVAVASHEGAAHPHTQYLRAADADALFLTPAEGNAAYQAQSATLTALASRLPGPLQALASGGGSALANAGRGAVTSGTGETFLATFRVPANSVAVGDVLNLTAVLQSSSTGTLAARIRAGTAGTVAGDTLVNVVGTSAAGTANSFVVLDAYVYIIALGPTGTVYAVISGQSTAAAFNSAAAAEAPGNVPTTGNWFITFSAAASAGTYTVRSIRMRQV